MKPSDGITGRPRRLMLALVAGLAAHGAAATDLVCAAPEPVDPRLAELLAADPDDPRINITSDQGDLGREGDASLSGNVRIRMGQRLLTADKAEVNAEARSVRLEGAVEYLDPAVHVRGAGGEFAGGAGSFEGAQFELRERGVRGAATDVRLRDESIIDLEGVRYTACPPGNYDWKLRADKISIDQESRVGTGRNVQLEFKGATILYAPWITFPVGDTRKSGLLFPTIGSSSKTGTQLAVPYYWNIAPNYDATITTRYFSSRGLRLDPEVRYLTERSEGTFNAEYLFDDLEDGGSRSLLDLEHVTHLQPTTRLRADAANASDEQYFEDFGVGFEGTSVTFLDRLAEARHDTRHWSIIGRVQDYQILDPDLADADEPYSILPQVGVVGRWRDFAPRLSATLRGEATNFSRDTGVEGVRLDVEPTLDWRAETRATYLAASAAWRATSYSLSNADPGVDESPLRNVPTLSLDTGLVLERTAGSKRDRLQTLEPRALFLYVPYRDQDDLPVFDSGLPDLNLVQLFRTNRYVGADRVGDANQLSIGLTSRLLDAAGGRQYLSATLGQAIYFEDPRVRLPDEPVRDRASSDMIAELDLAAFKNWSARLGYQWNPDETQSEKSEFYLQYRPASDRVVNAGYRFRRDLLEQVDVSAAWPITRQWRGFGRWVYSLDEEKTLDQFLGFEYASCCWAVRVVTRRFVSSRTGDTDTSIGLQLELKGLSSVGVDNEAFLRDAIRGYSALPPETRL
ncbi:MAG: LPS-assembly protein LptD [Steroidobacteraceae bacterium]|nr:LPS-assembly protein LptD [Steroidobacteraceae bacterium]